MIRTALALAGRGFHVFPCAPRAKEPATAHGCKDATTDADAIRAWWLAQPTLNVGVATGRASNLLVLDIDGLDAECEIRRLEADHGELPPTVEAITARGRHLWFRCPDRPVRNSAGKVADGVDVRADGGYVLAPPSIHPTGRRYEWSVDCGKGIVAAPDWLVERISAPAGNVTAPTPPAEWRALAASGVGEGARDSSATRLAGYLLRRFVDPVVVLELLHCWNAARCAPPLPAADIERIVDSIAGRELRRRRGDVD